MNCCLYFHTPALVRCFPSWFFLRRTTNIKLALHRAPVSAGIVRPSSHWNKDFCSQIFLDGQTELLSSALSLYSHTKAALNCPAGQPMSSELPWLGVHAAASERQIPAALPRVSRGQKNFLKRHHCANCLYKINVRLVLCLCRGAIKIPVDRKITQTDMNASEDLKVTPPQQQVWLQMSLLSDLGL